MKCPNCGNEQIPEGSRFCPACGQALQETAKPDPKTEISVSQNVGSVSDGKVAGVQIENLKGNVSIESTVNQIEAKVIEGQYVDRQTITQNILVLGPDALDQIVQKLSAMQGIDKQNIQKLGEAAVPENVSNQIVEVVAAQREAAAKGVSTSPEAAYRLGMLAAYNREYDTAMDYFHQAIQANPEYAAAYETIAWLQQTRANEYLTKQQFDQAMACLAEARSAAIHTDPLDPRALAQRGYISKTLAQIAEARKHKAERDQYYEEAARMFEQAAKLDPNDPSAQNGLGNVQYARGNMDQAIVAYKRAIKLEPRYASAYNDLALAFEGKMDSDRANAAKWRKKALDSWRKTYELAPQDPTFSADYILTIGQRIKWLESLSG
jgi:tetratricopeptide (TPR) repeat protein